MNRPWMPLYIAEYLADTGHLTVAEHGAYMMLIMHYWQKDGLPADERQIARITRMTPEQWAESRDTLAAFFQEGWRHKRLDAEIAHAEEIIGKRKAAAELMHSKRAAKAEQKHTHARVSVLVTPNEVNEPNPEGEALPRARFDEIEARLSEAAGDSPLAVNVDISPIVRLIEAGWNLERDILPVVREMVRGGKRPRSWTYVARTLEGRAADLRAQGPPPGASPPANSSTGHANGSRKPTVSELAFDIARQAREREAFGQLPAVGSG